MNLKPEQAEALIGILQDAGWVVCAFNPEQAAPADAGSLFEVMYRAGTEFIEAEPEDDGGN